MKFDIVTIFPRMVQAGLAEGVVGRGIERGLVDVAIHDLRDFTSDRHRTVDDMPYGGGPGMVMKVEPIVRAVEHVRAHRGHGTVVLLTPQGRPFTQAEAVRLRARAHVVLLCGRYEGIDDRVRTLVAAEELSIGDFVMSGGEVAALAVVDAVSRLVPGVVGDQQSVEGESFTGGGVRTGAGAGGGTGTGDGAPPPLLPAGGLVTSGTSVRSGAGAAPLSPSARTLFFPVPPRTVSTPSPPTTWSSPLWPSIASSPRPPKTSSSPVLPERRSSPSPP